MKRMFSATNATIATPAEEMPQRNVVLFSTVWQAPTSASIKPVSGLGGTKFHLIGLFPTLSNQYLQPGKDGKGDRQSDTLPYWCITFPATKLSPQCLLKTRELSQFLQYYSLKLLCVKNHLNQCHVLTTQSIIMFTSLHTSPWVPAAFNILDDSEKDRHAVSRWAWMYITDEYYWFLSLQFYAAIKTHPLKKHVQQRQQVFSQPSMVKARGNDNIV